MDHEQIARTTQEKDRLIRKNKAAQVKEQQRLDKKNRRINKRSAPYGQLEKRNKAIYDRVSKIAALKDPVVEPEPINPHRSVQHLVYVVIGPTETTQTTPNHTTVASVKTDQWEFNGEDKKRATVKFFAVPREIAEEVSQDLSSSPISRGKYIELKQEDTYAIGTYDTDMHTTDVSGRRFSPIKGLMRIF